MSKCPAVRIGKEKNFMMGNWAMRSFLHVFMLRKHFENLPPKTSPNHLCALQVGATDTKLLDSADMSWFGLLRFISEELATATFMETNQNELRCSNCILNEAQTYEGDSPADTGKYRKDKITKKKQKKNKSKKHFKKTKTGKKPKKKQLRRRKFFFLFFFCFFFWFFLLFFVFFCETVVKSWVQGTFRKKTKKKQKKTKKKPSAFWVVFFFVFFNLFANTQKLLELTS